MQLQIGEPQPGSGTPLNRRINKDADPVDKRGEFFYLSRRLLSLDISRTLGIKNKTQSINTIADSGQSIFEPGGAAHLYPRSLRCRAFHM